MSFCGHRHANLSLFKQSCPFRTQIWKCYPNFNPATIICSAVCEAYYTPQILNKYPVINQSSSGAHTQTLIAASVHIMSSSQHLLSEMRVVGRCSDWVSVSFVWRMSLVRRTAAAGDCRRLYDRNPHRPSVGVHANVFPSNAWTMTPLDVDTLNGCKLYPKVAVIAIKVNLNIQYGLLKWHVCKMAWKIVWNTTHRIFLWL